jgi:prolyl-tRNA synthetase
MWQSELFFHTQKEAPKDEVSKNAQLLVRAGFVDKLMAGVYTFLPLGLRVLKKIEEIIRSEMLRAGGQEILMPVLQPKENWMKTGRWNTYDTLFKFASFYSKNEYALGPTHEEVISPLAGKFSLSYKDLPFSLFQIQTKFRDEKRVKSGLLRGREFLMKDLYSFHTNDQNLDDYYEKMKDHYKNIFNKTGIKEKTYLTFASGGTFSKYSHEFQTITDGGEDKIFLCEKCGVAVNSEIINDQNSCPECGNKKLTEKKAIEVGNIFKLKTKYSVPFDLKFTDEKGKKKDVLMGCYGIGISRLMGAIVEVNNDNKGIIWPETVAPFKVHLIELKGASAEKIYDTLVKNGIEVLYDDRDVNPGEKFVDADLIGIPYRVVVSEKTISENKVELKKRNSDKIKLIDEKELFEHVR